MSLDPTIAAIRFGTGRAPGIETPPDAASLLRALGGPDEMAQAHPIPSFSTIFDLSAEVGQINKAERTGEASAADLERRDALRAGVRDQKTELAARTVARGLDTRDGLRERLTWFWADHFTVISKRALTRSAVSMFVEDAIRPHVAGRFSDMLKAVAMHPMMLLYLDQARSVGPNSKSARNRPGRGLNENYARELMELHTLGVDGPYTQDDVRQLAELLAGMRGSANAPFRFYENLGEPGPETVLGRSYGRRAPKLDDVVQILEDLATHPATARHIARKLAVHFSADQPDPDLVDALSGRFSESGGDLMAVTETLLTHPATQGVPLSKVKPPLDFVVSSLRALGVRGADVVALEPKRFKRRVLNHMAFMGQTWQQPLGPDGWPEDSDSWITPQSLAARITWAMGLERHWRMAMPDPRDFVETALGPLASEPVRFAARAAETRAEGVGIVLTSPDFQRR